ncbi:hypothetical protein CTEN210_09783 [Chaetoceros tenuissimus]|uniref:Uncharacterized protein n=1 Tax=Chaetoceros tenuissimus TaxID=426638 RepID=A0AAD3CW49_9STRA|nr:hypothetical protein CTEN210_09783 [Chaetoceros tenuissimus]
MITQARKRMRLEDRSSSSEGKLLEPSATMNDLPSEVMKNIFSFVGKGNYCFVAPVSKDFCYNYLTMDVIEDKFAHKMDCQLAIGKNKITTAEAASTSFELAEYCFFNAPEDFKRQVVKKAVETGRKDIVEIGEAMGIEISESMSPEIIRNNLVKIARRGDLEMIKLLQEKGVDIASNKLYIMNAAANKGQLGILKWLRKNNLCSSSDNQSLIVRIAARSGRLSIIKWAKEVAGFNLHIGLINDAAASGNLDLIKYLRSKEISWKDNTFCFAVLSGNIAMLQYLIDNECPHDEPRICSNAVVDDDREKALEVLQWLHEHNVPWDEETCNTSARKGNLKALEYARLNGCQWNETCLEQAVRHRNVEVIEYCLQNGCPIGTRAICKFATTHNQDHDQAFQILKLLRKFSVPWSTETCTFAACNGHFEALKWAVSEGCNWDRQKCANYAAEHGDIEVLKWMKIHGCQWDLETIEGAARKGNLETLKFLRSQGCPCNESTFLEAIESRNFDIVEYCVENVFPFDDRLYEDIIRYFRYPIPIMKLLRSSDYPWHPSACFRAADYNNLRLLRWLRFSGCAWDECVCNIAVINDNLDILRYAHESGCPWTKETYAFCFGNGGLDDEYIEIPTKTDIVRSEEIFQYIEDNNCPKPGPHDWNII